MAILGKTTMTEGVVAGTLSVSGDINGSDNCFVQNNLCCGGILGNDDSDGNFINQGPILSLGDGLDRQLIFEGDFSSTEGVCWEDSDESLILVSNQFHFVGNLESDIPTNNDYVGFIKTTVNIHGNLKTDDLSVTNGIYPKTSLSGDLGSSSNVWNNGYIKTLNITGSCTAPAFYQTSDIRKKNIRGQVSLDKCYSMLDKCQEIIYTLKDQTKEQIGLIAQEVEEFFPEVVSTDAEGYKSLDYAKLVVVCLKLIKDLSNRISKLEENG